MLNNDLSIEYKDKNVEIAIRGLNNLSFGERESKVIINFINSLKGCNEDIEIKDYNITKDANTKSKNDDRPMIRERLPNQIDMSELEIKKAVTEEPMIRCSCCGQASKAIVHISATEYYLLRKVKKGNKKTFETVMSLDSLDAVNKIIKPGKSSILDYHNDIMKIKQDKKLKNTDLNVSSETIIQCPVCGTKASFKTWTEAFKHPIEFGFETDLLCDVCGKEAVSTIDKDKNEIIKCEYCGHIEQVV